MVIDVPFLLSVVPFFLVVGALAFLLNRTIRHYRNLAEKQANSDDD